MRQDLRLFALLGAGLAALAPSAVSAAGTLPRRDLLALEEDGLLVRFWSDDPGTVVSTVRLFHWPPQTGEVPLMTIATGPATGGLYGLTRALELATIDPVSGKVTVIGPRLDSAVPGFGSQYAWLAFDPARDVARVVDAYGHQIRLDPATGAAIDGDPVASGVQTDADWHWAAGDPNGGGGRPQPHGFAYAADPSDSSKSTAYAIVGTGTSETLVTVGGVGGAASADGGAVHTVGSLGGIPGGGLQPFGFAVAQGAALLEFMHPYHAGAYLVGVDLAAGTYGPRPNFSQGSASPEPATMIGLPGKANFNALAWMPADIVPPPPPPPPPASSVLDVRRGRMRFDRRHHPADSIRLRGTLEFPAALRTGDTVRVTVGSVTQTFELDGLLRGASGEDRVRFAPGRGAASRFDVRLRSEDFSSELAVPQVGVRLTLPMSVEIDGEDATGSVRFVLRSVTRGRAVGVVR